MFDKNRLGAEILHPCQHPTLAAFLGFIPGVGAFYNGQYQKGVVHVLMFPALIMLTDREGIFGILIPFYFFYMAWDAYMTARSKVTGEAVPDPLGINNLFDRMPPATNSSLYAYGYLSSAASPLGRTWVGSMTYKF